MAKIISVITSNTKPGPKRVDPDKPTVYILKVDGDPSAGSGTEAPIGSLAIYQTGNSARKFFKSGSSNTDWEEETGIQSQINTVESDVSTLNSSIDPVTILTTTITGIEVLNLYIGAFEKTIIPAPGAGKYIELVSLHVWLDFNTTPYDDVGVGEDLSFRWATGAGNGTKVTSDIAGVGFGDQSSDQHRLLYPLNSGEITPVVDTGIVATLGGNWWAVTPGDSSIYVRSVYKIKDLAFDT